jgi:biopolymer transport protein ExbB
MIYEFFSSSFNTIMEMFKSGGIITYIITLIGIYGIATAFEKILYFRKISKITLPHIIGIVNEAMERGGALEALRSIGRYQNPISRIISEALKIGYRNITEVEDAMERVFIAEMGNMTKGIDTLKTIIEIAPILGLFGTVVGMWYTFKALGINANPSQMALGINVALITTIAGLIVAITLLPIYSYIKNRIDKEIDTIEIAKKMTNWRAAEMKIKVETDLKMAITVLGESDGIMKVKELYDDDANIWVAFKPNMLEKSINNIIMEKCNSRAQIVESKLKL